MRTIAPRWTPGPYHGMLWLAKPGGNGPAWRNLQVKPSLSAELAEDILRDAGQFVDRATAYLKQEGYV